MAVITADGLIGRIKSVSQFTSQVELLSDVNRTLNISAMVQGQENIFGVIEGYDLEKRALLFEKIPKETPLRGGANGDHLRHRRRLSPRSLYRSNCRSVPRSL